MIILITGASHTGKTLLAQRLLEKYQYPYLSIDHELEAYLWPIVREMIKTAVENKQNLIIEGCYIPSDWEKDFSDKYLNEIRYYCLVMSQKYIEQHFSDIKKYASEIEQRMDDTGCTMETVMEDNAHYLKICEEHGYPYILIDGEYKIEIQL